VRFLLDVNLLMALLWENHEQHPQARKWLAGAGEFVTCPLVQLGFVRVSSHPMLGFGMVPEVAFHVLRKFLEDERHHFVPDDLSCADRALLSEQIAGPNQVTDHYLAALARQHGLCLATFDAPLSRAFAQEKALVSLIS
jgi:toxin-antitoxin system PIN domain toxin